MANEISNAPDMQQRNSLEGKKTISLNQNEEQKEFPEKELFEKMKINEIKKISEDLFRYAKSDDKEAHDAVIQDMLNIVEQWGKRDIQFLTNFKNIMFSDSDINNDVKEIVLLLITNKNPDNIEPASMDRLIKPKIELTRKTIAQELIMDLTPQFAILCGCIDEYKKSANDASRDALITSAETIAESLKGHKSPILRKLAILINSSPAQNEEMGKIVFPLIINEGQRQNGGTEKIDYAQLIKEAIKKG